MQPWSRDGCFPLLEASALVCMRVYGASTAWDIAALIPTPQSLHRRQSHKPHKNYTTATFDFDYGIDDEAHLNEDSTVQDQDDVTICCPAFQTSLSPALELKQATAFEVNIKCCGAPNGYKSFLITLSSNL